MLRHVFVYKYTNNTLLCSCKVTDDWKKVEFSINNVERSRTVLTNLTVTYMLFQVIVYLCIKFYSNPFNGLSVIA